MMVIGGEFSTSGTTPDLLGNGVTYDPGTDTWSGVAFFNGNQDDHFGDDPTALLANGQVLGGSVEDNNTRLYDPAGNQWSPTGTKLRLDRSDEEGWALLSDQSVLSYDVYASQDANGNPGVFHAQRYVEATGLWTDASSLDPSHPALPLSDASVNSEMRRCLATADGRQDLRDRGQRQDRFLR